MSKSFTTFTDGDYGVVFDSRTGRKVFEGDLHEVDSYIASTINATIDLGTEAFEDEVPQTFNEALMRMLPKDD